MRITIDVDNASVSSTLGVASGTDTTMAVASISAGAAPVPRGAPERGGAVGTGAISAGAALVPPARTSGLPVGAVDAGAAPKPAAKRG